MHNPFKIAKSGLKNGQHDKSFPNEETVSKQTHSHASWIAVHLEGTASSSIALEQVQRVHSATVCLLEENEPVEAMAAGHLT